MAEPRSYRGSIAPMLQVKVRPQIIRNTSTFSYLKRTTIQDFDKRIRKTFPSCYIRTLAAGGATPPALPSVPAHAFDPPPRPIFSALRRHCASMLVCGLDACARALWWMTDAPAAASCATVVCKGIIKIRSYHTNSSTKLQWCGFPCNCRNSCGY